MGKTRNDKYIKFIGMLSLLYLLKNKIAYKSELRDNLKVGKLTIIRAIDLLKEKGLIEEKRSTPPKIYALTEKGYKLAKEIEKIWKELG